MSRGGNGRRVVAEETAAEEVVAEEFAVKEVVAEDVVETTAEESAGSWWGIDEADIL